MRNIRVGVCTMHILIIHTNLLFTVFLKPQKTDERKSQKLVSKYNKTEKIRGKCNVLLIY